MGVEKRCWIPLLEQGFRLIAYARVAPTCLGRSSPMKRVAFAIQCTFCSESCHKPRAAIVIRYYILFHSNIVPDEWYILRFCDSRCVETLFIGTFCEFCDNWHEVQWYTQVAAGAVRMLCAMAFSSMIRCTRLARLWDQHRVGRDCLVRTGS